jgi:hypothetical protein
MTPAQKLERLNDNITNMKRKGMLPQHTISFFDQTPENLNKLLHATEQQAFKEWSCNVCQITVYGPKKLLLEHHKTHSARREIKENEIFQNSYKLY